MLGNLIEGLNVSLYLFSVCSEIIIIHTNMMNKVGVKNLVIFLDEVDKTGSNV